jgi:hypothetical protein
MRKIALITASASLVLCCSWINKQEINLNKLEIDAYCGDLLYYLQVDLEEGKIDSMVFDTYSANIKEIKQRNNEK